MSDIKERLEVCINSEDGYWPTVLAKDALQTISQLQTDKANVIQQAEGWAMEAKTMQGIVKEILNGLELPQESWNAVSLVLNKFGQLQTEIERLNEECVNAKNYMVKLSSSLGERDKEINRLRGVIEEMSEDCPNCDNSGTIAHYRDNGECEPLQCEFCYTVKNSKFNVEALQPTKEDSNDH